MSGSEFVTLKDGIAVPIEALRVLWRLENEGLSFRLDEGDIIVTPRRLLTDRDRQLLKEHKRHIMEIVRYCEEVRA